MLVLLSVALMLKAVQDCGGGVRGHSGKGRRGQDGTGWDGGRLADTVGQWNSSRGACILDLPKNPNQFFVLAT